MNARAAAWLEERVDAVPSRSTGQRPVDRLAVERSFLGPLPWDRFDTDYVESRRVHNIVPFIAVDGIRYSVPPQALGQMVEICRRLDYDQFEVRRAGPLTATHTLVAGLHLEVWDPAHSHTAEAAAMADRSERPVLRLVTDTDHTDTDAIGSGRLDLGEGYDVDEVDLAVRYPIDVDGEVGA